MTAQVHPGSTDTIPSYLQDMVRRAPPTEYVVRGSTPVISFGNSLTAEVASLGINPSASEFVDKAFALLQGSKRRLATLESLGAEDPRSLTIEQVRSLLDDCSNYFSSTRNPYRRWFDPLDRLIQKGVGATYYNGSACHLDLVQWATFPIWGQLKDAAAKQLLLSESHDHLVNQLKYGRIRVVLLNGMEVVRRVQDGKLALLEPVDHVLSVGSLSCRLFLGQRDAIKFIGWSTNLQSSFGVSSEFKRRLAEWIAANHG